MQICNTKTDAFEAYSKSETVLMTGVCMTVPNPEVLNLTLYTADCKRDVRTDIYTLTNQSQSEVVLYRLYMVGGSYVLPKQLINAHSRYQKTYSAEKASTYNEYTCGNADNVLTKDKVEHFGKYGQSGYYVILCIIREKGTDEMYSELQVSEQYYVTPTSVKKCQELESNGKKCCGFSDPSVHKNCVYLSYDRLSLPYDKFVPVDVNISYSSVVPTLLIVFVVVFAVVFVLALLFCVKVSRRR